MKDHADAAFGTVALDSPTYPVTGNDADARVAQVIGGVHQHDKRVGKRSSSPHPLDIGRSG
ncbi:MAG TPA: hypothetical protein VIO36_00300 [Anaerolineaceae bacterium]